MARVRPKEAAVASVTPDDAAEGGQHHRLDQELQQDVALQRADREPDADLARALGDRDQHDVHDADAAHQQADAGDGAEQRGQHAVVR